MAKNKTETTEAATPTATVMPTAAEVIASLGGEKSLEAKLKAAQGAKAEAFVRHTAPSDYYVPAKGKEERALFLTSGKDGRTTVYSILVTKDGKPTEVKIKGAHSLNALRKAAHGQAISLTYNGEKKAEDGRINPDWSLGFLVNG